MKLFYKKTLYILFFFILINNSSLLAQGMGMGGPPCGGIFPPCPVPLDGGVSILLIAGAAYGGKKVYDTFKKNPH